MDCAKVLLIGARGSAGEFGPEDLGPSSPPPPVQGTRNLLAERGVGLDVEGVIHPAHSP
ncbi:hypothetical protein [Saccharothrix sp. Mg75]|uniref:hypothetical protein n=1 Tax=Saccharothrix sp. Mg75 TaxID=3445357 RepID=UPI003EEDE19C